LFSFVLLSLPSSLSLSDAVASRPFTSDFQHYSILLIITDGVINDMNKTIEALVVCLSLSLSFFLSLCGRVCCCSLLPFSVSVYIC
jgi:hypothetical protein